MKQQNDRFNFLSQQDIHNILFQVTRNVEFVWISLNLLKFLSSNVRMLVNWHRKASLIFFI